MLITGHLNRVEEPLPAFVQRFLASSGDPAQGFADWGPARVYCVVRLGSQFASFGFFPPTSFRATADAQGHFVLDVPDSLRQRQAFLIVYTPAATVTTGGLGGLTPPVAIPVFAPVYRSASFTLDQTTPDERRFFLSPQTLDVDQAFTQAEVTALTATLVVPGGVAVKARIRSRAIEVRSSVTVSGATATVRFDIRLRPDTSPDLTRLLRATAENIDFDLPEPEFITGLCVDEDDIERQIRGAVRDMNVTLNERVQALMPAAAAAVLAPIATVTMQNVKFPVIGTQDVPVPSTGVGLPTTFTIVTRGILGDPCVGLPREPFA